MPTIPEKHGTSIPIKGHGQTAFDSAGSFFPGTLGVLFFTFIDIKGQAYDPSDLDIHIYDPNDVLVDESTALDRIEMGVFGYNFDIPKDATKGTYKAVVTYVIETIDGPLTQHYTQQFVVTESSGRYESVYSYRMASCRALLETLVGYVQRIPIWNETVRFNKNKNIGQVSFGRWNQTARTEITINGQPRESGYSLDYLKGWIYFDKPLSEYDEVKCSYNFRWFTDSELDSFIDLGLQQYNVFPPMERKTINQLDPFYVIAVEYGAATNLIRRWMMDIQFQEPAKIFGGMQRANEVFGHLDTLKKNYEEMLKTILNEKKNGPYPTARTITVPEFTLPGGRSRWFRYLYKA